MYDIFFRKFNDKVTLSCEEEDFIRQYLTSKKLRKEQYMLQEMDSCKSIALDEKGDEHITGFALEGWTMGDLAKFIIEFFFVRLH